MTANITTDGANISELLQSKIGCPKIHVGLSIFVDVLYGGKIRKCKTRILGWFDEQYFFLEAPTINGSYLDMKPGQALTVRFVSDGTIYGFNSYLTRRMVEPIMVWVLPFATRLEAKRLRTHKRIPVLLPACLNEGVDNALILDLSKGGALLEVNEKYNPGDSLHMKFHLPNGNTVDMLSAEITNFKKVDETYQLGVAFDCAAEKAITLVSDFIDQLHAISPSETIKGVG